MVPRPFTGGGGTGRMNASWNEGAEVLLGLRRPEAGRPVVETPAGEQYQSGIDGQRNGALADDGADAGGIMVSRPGEEPIERPEKPAEQFIHRARERVLGRVVVFEQRGAQRGRERE